MIEAERDQWCFPGEGGMEFCRRGRAGCLTEGFENPWNLQMSELPVYQYFGIILGFVALWATEKQRRSLVNTNCSVSNHVAVQEEKEKLQSCNVDTAGVCGDNEFGHSSR